MTKSGLGIISTLIAALLVSTTAWAQGTVVVAVPAKAGAVEGTIENSDAFIWRLFTEFAPSASKGHPSIAGQQKGPSGLLLDAAIVR
jgi:hypothetical protein